MSKRAKERSLCVVERVRGCEIGKGWPEWALALEL